MSMVAPQIIRKAESFYLVALPSDTTHLPYMVQDDFARSRHFVQSLVIRQEGNVHLPLRIFLRGSAQSFFF